MKKVVLNACYGGFSLSQKAYEFLGIPWDGFGFHYRNDERDNPDLVKCVETLGKEANGHVAELEIEEFDDYNYTYSIGEYDGYENLILRPLVHVSKLKVMDVNEIVEYLTSLGIQVAE